MTKKELAALRSLKPCADAWRWIYRHRDKPARQLLRLAFRRHEDWLQWIASSLFPRLSPCGRGCTSCGEILLRRFETPKEAEDAILMAFAKKVKAM